MYNQDQILQSPLITPEEEIIRELVDDIYEAESKISEISTNKTESKPFSQTPQITSNTLKINELRSKISELNDQTTQQCSLIHNQMKDKQLSLSDLNTEISQLKHSLTQFNPISFKCLLLSKYILSNSGSDFLTNEQIEDIITNVNSPNEKNTELKRIRIELQSYETTKQNILSQLEEKQMKYSELENTLRMLKEEKGTVRDELINLISCKESFEEILKMKITNISSLKNEGMNTMKRFSIIGQINTKEIELYPYELLNINSHKGANVITENIIEIFEIANIAVVNNNNINISNIEFDPPQNPEMENNISRSMATFMNLGIINNNNNNNNNNNSTHQFKIDKDNLTSVIQSEIATFQKSLKHSTFILYQTQTIQQFLTSLSNIILNTILSYETSNSQDDLCLCGNNLSLNISSATLSQFLLYSFKVLHYENIIESKLSFVNKEYKSIKKEIHKQITQINSILNKLTTKLEDTDSRITELQNREKIYIDEYEKNKPQLSGEQTALSPSEKNYIEICTKGNILLKHKNEIENEIKGLENEIQKTKGIKEQKIQGLQTQINKLTDENKQLQNEIELQQLKENEQIIQLRKLIADKFNLIKTQLQIYKNKHGSNLDIYNKLIDSINITIKSTYNKNILFNSSNIPSNPNTSTISYNNNNRNSSFFENNAYHTEKKKHRNRSSADLPNVVKLTKNTNNSNIYVNDQSVDEHFFDEALNNRRSNSNKKPLFRALPIKKPKVFNRNKPNEEVSAYSSSIASVFQNKHSDTLQSDSYNVSPILPSKNIINNNNNQINSSGVFSNPIKLNKLPIGNSNKQNDINKSLNYSGFPKGNNRNSFNKNSNSIHIPKTKSANTSIIGENKQKRNPDKEWLIEKDKLAKTIQNLKETISHLNNNNNNNNQNTKENKLFSPEKDRNIPNNDTSTINATYISNKISPLTQITFCYYRLFSNTNQKFNPLSTIPINQITNPPFNFIKGTICLSKNHKVVHISPSISLTQPIEINVEDINNTIVNSTIKKVIEIHREYRKEKMNKVFDIEVFPDKEIFKNMKLSRDDIIKAALNKNFNFSIMVNHTKRYEFILNNYDDFKMWINGVAFLLKYNNNQIN